MSNISRRKFLKTGAAALAGITIAPSTILGMSHGHISPTDKLNLAAVGIGGMGHANINHVKGTENIVALCDEPDGSAKFFATAFQNAKMKEAVTRLLEERDGLALGICNGFQALIKLGLVPYGKITGQTPDSPTLTYNTIGRHISKMVYTKVVTNKSPWLAQAELGATYCRQSEKGSFSSFMPCSSSLAI